MSIRYEKLLVIVLCVPFLTRCAAVDQYQSRIYDGNLNSQNAMNQEILLNIVRASRFRGLNFVAITQVTGGQSETLSTGLPTISLGPHQTAAEHIYQVSNSAMSNVTGGYQSNPLLSTAFQSGMLAPISPRTAALLVASHPREVVFFAIVDSITIQSLKTHQTAKLLNDPDTDYDTDSGSTPDRCRAEYNSFARDSSSSRAKAFAPSLFPGRRCSYSKFANLLKVLIDFGLTARLSEDMATGALASGAASTGAASPPAGRVCAELSSNNKVITGLPTCGSRPAPTSKPQNITLTSSEKKTEDHKEIATGSTIVVPLSTDNGKKTIILTESDGDVSFSIDFRSPFQVFNYLGTWLRNSHSVTFGDYVTRSAENVLARDEPYLNILSSLAPDCYTSIVYLGQAFCVPQRSLHTAMLMDIVQNLRNLAITPNDLNSAFTVRLSSAP